ncbi:hypothetical protein [Gimesia fumaroli]|uniref:Leucine Rich repeats (2 copies) n=1 Tax=Gimesia fumaroli TaxID=2527976 RepID=A0A518IJT3_9PLAN|nr:hypothetical protein [Gimesia fumaroli]QDV53357.1 hypothetical protein Enr17x_54310 [Gimesia fumaroli]
MLRQFICPVAAVLLALAGIGGLIISSDHSQNAVAEKQTSAESTPPSQADVDSKQREQRLKEINLILSKRAPEFSGAPPQPTPEATPVWLDPALDNLYQQIKRKRAGLWFPRNNEPFSIWVGNPSKTVDGKKVYQHTEVLKNVIPLVNQLPFPVRIWFYGTRDQTNPELGECIETLSAVKQLAGVKFSLCRINERGYTALKNLPNLTNLEILYSHLDEAGLSEITQAKKLNRLHLNFGNQSISLQAAEQVLTLPLLEDLKIHVDIAAEDVTPFWEKMTKCSQLTSVEIDLGSVTQNAMIYFLKNGDRQNLRSWIIREIFPRKRLADALALAPNLEVLKVPSGRTDDIFYLLEQVAEHQPRIKQLVIGWDTGNHLSGDQARAALTLLTNFPQLERCHIPVELPDARALQPLTRLPHLQFFYCRNLNLDQDTLVQLAQMPALKRLEVDKLQFDQNAAHLLPWLSNVEKITIKDPTTLNDERLELLAKMPRLSKLVWCDIAIKEPIPLTKAARARFPQFEYDVCGK